MDVVFAQRVEQEGFAGQHLLGEFVGVIPVRLFGKLSALFEIVGDFDDLLGEFGDGVVLGVLDFPELTPFSTSRCAS